MPFVTADQLVAHAVGDYVLQSDWMATQKTRSDAAALAHAVAYSLPFLALSPSVPAWLFMVSSHFVIDRFRLARYACWAKNFIAPRWIDVPSRWRCPDHGDVGAHESLCPRCGRANELVELGSSARNHPWSECEATGYHKDRPAWLAVWLMFVCDNVMHVLCNAAALRWL